MSFLACGLEPVNSHGPFWMPWVSLEPPPVKMSSVLLLTLSVTKAEATAPLLGGGVTLLSAKTWSQSCVVAVVTLPSSSKTLVTLGVTRSSSCSTRSAAARPRLSARTFFRLRSRRAPFREIRSVMGGDSRRPLPDERRSAIRQLIITPRAQTKRRDDAGPVRTCLAAWTHRPLVLVPPDGSAPSGRSRVEDVSRRTRRRPTELRRAPRAPPSAIIWQPRQQVRASFPRRWNGKRPGRRTRNGSRKGPVLAGLPGSTKGSVPIAPGVPPDGSDLDRFGAVEE